MALRIAVLKERAAGERRVAITPETVKKFAGLGAQLAVESGAGSSASISDADYTEAGASGYFIPACVNPDLIGRVCEASKIPVNVLMMPGCPSAAELAELGVARISHGPWPYRRMLEDLVTRFSEDTRS